jgi:hypothetical protein
MTHFPFAERHGQHIVSAEIEGFGPYAVVSEIRRHDEERRLPKRISKLQQFTPVAIR